MYNAHALPLFAQLNQLTIYDLNKLALASFMFRYHANSFPPIFSGYFSVNSAVHCHYTRNLVKLHISFARTNIMKRQIRVCCPKLWNSIDSGIIERSRNLHSFKKLYKRHIILDYV